MVAASPAELASANTLAAIAPRTSLLDAASASALPTGLPTVYRPAALDWADELAREDEQKQKTRSTWSIAGSNALTAFNPNINFSQPTAVPTGRVRISSTQMVNAQMYEQGATEYRKNLQSGRSQRFALQIRKRLADRWSIATGLQTASNNASSQTSFAGTMPTTRTTFTGTQVLSPMTKRAQLATDLTLLDEPQVTRYRYRTAGIPVSVQYGNSRKPGWSVYARVGAAVDVLFRSRLTPENTALVNSTEYTLNSTDSPYRKVLASLRGGAGMQYRPAGAAWAVALGPTAETGLNSLNAEPAQSYWHQSRPYSVGVEASVEFGTKAAVVAH